MKGKYTSTRRRRFNSRFVALLSSLVLILGLAVGATIAYLADATDAVTNTFTPPTVKGEVDEDFDGTVKKNVTVTNTSDVDVFVRVKLVTYFIDANNNIVGKAASIPEFTPGAGWFEKPAGSDTYYYMYELKDGAEPATPLIGESGITLVQDADVNKQIVEVMVEAIQADGVAGETHPVEVWGVTYNDGDPATIS